MSLLGASGSGLAIVFLRVVPRWARLTRKLLSRRKADTRSSDNSLGCCDGVCWGILAGSLECNSGAICNASNKSCLFLLFIDLNALISASIICFGVLNPRG